MAFANFFDKIALGAAQILKGYDYDEFKTTLNKHCVGIAYDQESAKSFEGRVTLELSANLLARLYPSIAFVTLDGNSGKFVGQLEETARKINPEIDVHTSLKEVTDCIVVGSHSVDSNKLIAYVGSDNWRALLSSNSPVHSGLSSNPFGASAAACFGAANVFRNIFQKQLEDPRIDTNVDLSLLDYQKGDSAIDISSLDEIYLGEAFLVGIGAIGTSTIWTLSKLSNLSGTLHLVDPESIELSNLQRYVLAFQTDVEKTKVETAANTLIQRELKVIPHVKTWEEFVNERSDWNFPLVAVSVDSAQERCFVQASLPKWTVNAWTQEGDLGVSRHEFIGKNACLNCLYMPKDKSPNYDQQVASALNMSEALIEIRNLLYVNKPIGERFLSRIATALSIPVESIANFADLPLSSFYSEAVCGGIVLEWTKTNGTNVNVDAPMCFQSALAGIMLAAELIKHVLGLSLSDSMCTTRIDLLRPLTDYLNVPESKHPSGRCICQDSDYIEAYQTKYR